MTTPNSFTTWLQRWRHFLMNMILFTLCYQLGNFVAYQKNISRHISFSFETNIPFLEWMIIPYLSPVLFFLWSFLRAQTMGQLRVLSQRFVLATVCASFFFILYPLRFSTEKPEISTGLFAILFEFLALIDKPYNQLPSLHVAYCVIFWRSIKISLPHQSHQFLLTICLLLVAVSTAFVYQHHALDLLGGLLLGCVTIRLIRTNGTDMPVAFHYAMAASVLFLFAITIASSWLAFSGLYVSFSLSLISIAYWRRNRFFLRKKNGRHSFIIWMLYAPYLLGYRLSWLIVQYIERKKAAITLVTSHLWIGRRLSHRQAQLIPKDCTIVDLSPELSEIHNLQKQNYWHFPLLDLITPDPIVIQEISTFINNEIEQDRLVFLHCAMGYSRCILLANYMASESNSKKLQ